MRVAVLGGTGNIGIGLSLRLAIAGYDVIVGSRDIQKAKTKVEEYKELLKSKGYRVTIDYAENKEASRLCDLAILAIPFKHAYSLVEDLKNILEEKIVISPIVPMKKNGKSFIYDPPPEGSAAEKIASILENSYVVSAFHTIPAKRFADLDSEFYWDVPICGDDGDAKKTVFKIINNIDGLRPLDAGPLSSSRLVESLTPLLINLSLRNNLRDLSIRFV